MNRRSAAVQVRLNMIVVPGIGVRNRKGDRDTTVRRFSNNMGGEAGRNSHRNASVGGLHKHAAALPATARKRHIDAAIRRLCMHCTGQAAQRKASVHRLGFEITLDILCGDATVHRPKLGVRKAPRHMKPKVYGPAPPFPTLLVRTFSMDVTVGDDADLPQKRRCIRKGGAPRGHLHFQSNVMPVFANDLDAAVFPVDDQPPIAHRKCCAAKLAGSLLMAKQPAAVGLSIASGTWSRREVLRLGNSHRGQEQGQRAKDKSAHGSDPPQVAWQKNTSHDALRFPALDSGRCSKDRNALNV